MTLKERLSNRHNFLNIVRLGLASAVILGHAWPLTGNTDRGLEILSYVAVNAFFILRGYLIAGSRMRTAFVPYLWRRLLRIYPGFIASLIMVAAVFAPLAAIIEGNEFDARSAVGYVLSNITLQINQQGIDGTLTNVPFSNFWNPSLWTLSYEALAYVALGVLLSFTVAVRYARLILPALLVAVMILRVLAHGPWDVTTGFYLNSLRLGGYFLAGAVIWAWADFWRPRLWHAAVAGVVYALMTLIGWGDLFGQIPLAVVVLGAGSLPCHNWTTTTDLSYGVYIYGGPVQQTLVLLGTASWGIAANTMLTLLFTLPLALLSWLAVEKPALRAKSLLDPRIPVPTISPTMSVMPDRRLSDEGSPQ